MQSTAVDPAVTAAEKSVQTAQADAQQQPGMQDTSVQQQRQQQQGAEERSQYVEAQAAQLKKRLSVLDEQQQQEVKSILQRPQSLQQVQLASKRQHSRSPRAKLPSSPVKSEPAVGAEAGPASISTSMSQPGLLKQQQRQLSLEPMQTQQKAEALQQQQQQQQQQVPALQQPLQQQHLGGLRQQQQQEVQQLRAPQWGFQLQQQQRIEPPQQQQQQLVAATMSFDSNRSASTLLHYTTSVSQDRVGAVSTDQLAASRPGAVLHVTGTTGGAAVLQSPVAAIPTAAAAAGASADEMNVSSATSPSQLMQMIVDQARMMRAEQVRKTKELSRVNKKIQKLQQQKAELQAELESQGAFEGIDIQNVTLQQLQDMLAKVAEQRREVAEQLAAEERELEIQQQVLLDLQEQDREMDARLQRELKERLELLERYLQDGMVE